MWTFLWSSRRWSRGSTTSGCVRPLLPSLLLTPPPSCSPHLLLIHLPPVHALLMVLNLLGGVCFLFSGQDKGSMFGLGLVYAFFFIPLSFLCWFRPAYKAFRNDSSFNFMLFFFIFFCQFLFSCIMALGIPGSGGR